MMKLSLWRVRSLIVLSLLSFSMGSFGDDHGPGSRSGGKRAEERFPEFFTVTDALTKWFTSDTSESKLDNDKLSLALRRSDSNEIISTMKRAAWFAARTQDQCSNEAASKELIELMKLCLGEGGIFRGVENGKESKKLEMSLGELKACRTNFQDYFTAKREKAGSSAKDFAIDWEMEKKFKAMFDKLTESADSNAEVTDEEAKKSIERQTQILDKAKAAFKSMGVKDLCRVTDSNAGSSNARTNGGAQKDDEKKDSKPSDAKAKPWAGSNAQTAGGVQYDNECKPGEQCLKEPSKPSVNAAPPAPAPSGNGYGSYVPPTGGYGGGGYVAPTDPYGLGGCGAYGSCGGGRNYGGGGGYVPPAPAPGVLPPPAPFAPVGPGFGVGVGVKTAPRPYPPPLPYPPMPMPLPAPMPLFTATGATVKPWTSDVDTVSVTVKTTDNDRPSVNPLPTNMCGKPVCMPMFGGAMLKNQLGVNPYIRNPFLPVYGPVMQNPYTLINPSITPNPSYPFNPQYPGQPGVTPTYPGTNPTNPIAGTPQIGYNPVPPTRYNVPRNVRRVR